MSIKGFHVPGARKVVFELDPRTAADVWLHLEGSMHAEATTTSSRVVVAALLPALKRAIAATGYMRLDVMNQLSAQLRSKPAPPALDQAVRALGDA